MFVSRLTEPIDLFDGLTPLNDWLTRQHSAEPYGRCKPCSP
jgi:hypothetical protein